MKLVLYLSLTLALVGFVSTQDTLATETAVSDVSDEVVVEETTLTVDSTEARTAQSADVADASSDRLSKIPSRPGICLESGRTCTTRSQCCSGFCIMTSDGVFECAVRSLLPPDRVRSKYTGKYRGKYRPIIYGKSGYGKWKG